MKTVLEYYLKEDEEKESMNTPTPEQENQIREFITNTPNLKDEKFHKFLGKLDVNPHKAETVVYAYTRALAMKLKSMGEDPLNLK